MASTRRSDGEGSIYYDKSRDRHVGVLVTGWRDDKPIRKKVSAKSRAGAATKLRELHEKLQAGQLPQGRIPTVDEWMTYWLEQVAAERVRPSTYRGYETSISCYIRPLLGHHRLDRLTPEHISKAWTHLQTVGRPGAEKPTPLSPTTALQAHRILARALKVAHQRGVVTRNVATLLDAPTPADTEFEPLTVEEAKTVLATAQGKRNAARWSVALALGLRQGEALGLRWQDVDLDTGTIRIRKALGRVKGQGLQLGPVKSRAGKRTVVVPDALHAELKAHRIAQNAERLAAGSKWVDGDFVFARLDGTPTPPKDDWQQWKNLLVEARVPDRRLHDARHTAATLLLAQDVPQRVVMEILGHSRITMTSRYQHVADAMQRDAARKMGDALWG